MEYAAREHFSLIWTCFGRPLRWLWYQGEAEEKGLNFQSILIVPTAFADAGNEDFCFFFFICAEAPKAVNWFYDVYYIS